MKLRNHQMILPGGPGLNSNRFKTEYGDDRTPERGFEFQLAGRIDRETFPHIFGNLAIQRKGITAVAEVSPWSTHDNHATCLRIALGEDASGEVMKHLTDFEIEEITEAIAGLKNISVEVMDGILEDFEQLLVFLV